MGEYFSQLAGEAVAQVFLAGVATQIEKGEDGDGGGRGANAAAQFPDGAARLISTLFGPPGNKKVETTLDPAGTSARATSARSQM